VKLQFFTFYVAIMELPSRESNAAVNAFIWRLEKYWGSC